MIGSRIHILESVDVGGMAEILKAEDLDTQQILAIKRLLPQFADKPRFIQMFFDEARLSMRLHHPNIVQVYQLGRLDDAYTLAMEFVEGINLRELLQFCNVYDYHLPIPECLHIAIKILEGLVYAHNLTDEHGESLHIIHRDMSPPNILLSRTGEVKIIDFGLAKTRNQMHVTVPGLIKGKFSYLSPEAAYGETLDQRSDIYAVGIMLWEMLSAKPLFYDDIEANILDQVRKSQIPNLQPLNAQVDDALEYIVRKALQRGRSARYQSASEFYDALIAYRSALPNAQHDLATIISSLHDAIRHELQGPAPPLADSAPYDYSVVGATEDSPAPDAPTQTLSTLIPIDIILADAMLEEGAEVSEDEPTQVFKRPESKEAPTTEVVQADAQVNAISPAPLKVPVRESAAKPQVLQRALRAFQETSPYVLAIVLLLITAILLFASILLKRFMGL